jgi:thiol-disulfide isomerase/thioredoxin
VSDIGNSTVAGSEMHNKVLELVQGNVELNKLKKFSDNIMGYASFKKFKEKLPQSEVNVIVKEFQDATGEYNKERTKYITSLLNSEESLLFKVLLLQSYGLKNKEQSEFAASIVPQVVAEYGEEHFCTRTIKGLIEKAKVTQLTSAGSNFINVESNDLDGKSHQLKSVIGEGKYVLLEFWASWCAPCRKEFPIMKKAYAKFHAKGFEIYGISIDKKADDWKKASGEEKLPWINTHFISETDKNAQVKYNVSSIPANFLIGPDGKIIARNLRGEALAKKLDELISK